MFRQGGCIELRRDHDGGDPRHPRLRGLDRLIGQEEHAVQDPGNRSQLMVQKAEGAALARDVHEVCHSAVQQKAILRSDLDDIAHGRALLDVAACRPRSFLFRREPDVPP